MSKTLEFPELRQVYNYDCGASALQSILVYYGYQEREDNLLKKLKATRTDVFDNGIKIKEIVRVAQSYRLNVIVERGLEAEDLIDYIDRGIPVIVLLQAWRDKNSPKEWKDDYKDGHYVVAIGYTNNKIIFEDPSSYSRTSLTFNELEERWHAIDDNDKPDPISVAIVIKGKRQYRPNEVVKML